jgi:U4/U6 small nuclear ribonucleoprotein PRP3
VRKNAEQMNLTGVCIINPTFSMVYVEGAHKFIRNYKRLMLNRIAWTEPARQRGPESADLEADPDMDGEVGVDDKNKETATDAEMTGSSDSLDDNMCWLIWEGQLRDRAFSNFKVKTCPTDSAAKEVLGQKLACYWDQAKNWKPEEEFF